MDTGTVVVDNIHIEEDTGTAAAEEENNHTVDTQTAAAAAVEHCHSSFHQNELEVELHTCYHQSEVEEDGRNYHIEEPH